MGEYKEDIKIIQSTELPENLINGEKDDRNIHIKLMVSIPLAQNHGKVKLVNLFFSDEIISDEFKTDDLRITRDTEFEQICKIVKVTLCNQEDFLLKKFVKLALDTYDELQLSNEIIQFEVKSEHFSPKINP